MIDDGEHEAHDVAGRAPRGRAASPRTRRRRGRATRTWPASRRGRTPRARARPARRRAADRRRAVRARRCPSHVATAADTTSGSCDQAPIGTLIAQTVVARAALDSDAGRSAVRQARSPGRTYGAFHRSGRRSSPEPDPASVGRRRVRFAAEGGEGRGPRPRAPTRPRRSSAEIDGGGRDGARLPVDVSDPGSVEACRRRRRARTSGGRRSSSTRPGSAGSPAAEEETSERWSAIIGVNLTGTFLMCRYTLPYLLDGGGDDRQRRVERRDHGSAVHAPRTARRRAASSTSPGRSRSSTCDRGVRVNCVAPGGMRTPITKGFRLPEGADFDVAAAGHVAGSASSEPEEVAGLHRVRRVRRRPAT